MCGRVRISTDITQLTIGFEIPSDRPLPNFAPTWNGAPTDNLPVVRFAPDSRRSLDLLRWGLVPYWRRTSRPASRRSTRWPRPWKRSQSSARHLSGAGAWSRWTNFYEWQKVGKESQPYAIALADHAVMALAGLWETWRSPAGETVRSFTIVTCPPNELCAQLHNRMPLILHPTSWPLGSARNRPSVPS